MPIPELYDLATDPGEATNLYTRAAETVRTLESLLHDTRSMLDARPADARRSILGADARQRLKALGYVASSAEPRLRVYTDADDPKMLIGVSDELNRAVESFDAGARAAAMAAVRAIIRVHPSFSTAYAELGSMQRKSGDLAGAIDILDEAARRGIADQRMMIVLAGYLAESGRLQQAISLLEAVIATHPDEVEAYNSLGVVYMRTGSHDRARAAFKRVLELDPTSATAYANLGADDVAVGHLETAVGDLQRALDLDPRSYDALYNLALALWNLDRRDEARPNIDRFVREAPPARYAADIARLQDLVGVR